MTQSTLDVRPATKVPEKTSLRPDVQGLRSLAVLAVIADHLLGYPIGGFVGVDIFFVISGFLITGLLLREQERKGRISFADFYRRRVRRIMPVAVVVLLATVAAAWTVYPAGRAQGITSDGFWALIFGANWHYAAVGTDYMQAAGPVSPLQHFWSLAVEEQFYVVWPWLIVLILGFLASRFGIKTTRARRILGSVFFIVIVATFVFAVWESSANPAVAYFSTVSRTWELGVGALLAVAGGVFSKLTDAWRTILGYAGLAGIAWSLFFVTPSMPFPGPWAAVPVLATALVIAAGTGGEQRYMYPLTNRVSGYIGDISYSLYLWHFPVITILTALNPNPDVISWTIMVLLMFALSVASYHFIEDPIRKSSWLEPRNRGRRSESFFDEKAVFAGLGVLTLVTAMVVTLAVTRDTSVDVSSFQAAKVDLSKTGVQQTPKPEPTTAAEKLTAELMAANTAAEWPVLVPSVDELEGKFVPEWIEDNCLNTTEANLQKCLYGDPAATKTVALLGDSVSISWMPGLRESLGKQGWNIQVLTMGQCPAIEIPVTRPNNAEGFTEACAAHQSWALDKVNQINPEMVIVTSALSTTARVVDKDKNPNVLADWTQYSIRKLEELKTATTGQVVLLSAAMQGANLQECVTKVSRPSACNGTNADYFPMLAAEEKAATAVPGVRYVSTKDWFCVADRQCPSFAGSTPIFVDGAHITPAYSAKLGAVMGPALLGEKG
ncbi:acyltransferase [Paenarthrobacter sp. TYUT067]|uniref:acyltransferase family protein n=1 Tax=Paenarthrobacter sp. TYUT067 TaxID=2926245 RepID=UPI00202ED745|nr:acyltransferase family protein [Paenarthrobacter sp. TYUT067]MCM0615271.1 acyltransferase [Paenarthrobacter sp. TYUT067]